MDKRSFLRHDVRVIREDVKKREKHHLEMLREGLQASFENLLNFQAWVAEKMRQIGMQVDEFVVEYEELFSQPAYRKTLRENFASLRRGPNIVGHLSAGSKPRKKVLFYAHADKLPETYEWAKDQPDMVEKDGRLYGPGIADDVSGIIAILGALETFKRLELECSRDLMVASLLGKQLSIFGTYGLMTRYGPMDEAIYVHPAESGNGLREIHMASNGMIEFHIQIEGRGPNNTDPFQTLYSGSSINAAEKGLYLFNGLQNWAWEASQHYRHHGLERLAGQALSLLVSEFIAGTENLAYEIPLRCSLRGTISFPPNANLDKVQNDLKEAFERLVKQDPWLSDSHAELEWGDHIGESAQSDERSALLRMASNVIKEITGKTPSYYYGYALSDIRYPILYWNAQAFGFGPLCGCIGTESEWVDRKEYLDTIIAVSQMLRQVC